MKWLALVLLVLSSQAYAQKSDPLPVETKDGIPIAKGVPNPQKCKLIGMTEKGDKVYEWPCSAVDKK
jgi:hypothetical protein